MGLCKAFSLTARYAKNHQSLLLSKGICVKPASNAVIGKVKEVYGVLIEKAVVAEAAVKAGAAKVEAKATGERQRKLSRRPRLL